MSMSKGIYKHRVAIYCHFDENVDKVIVKNV